MVALSDPQFKELMDLILYLGVLALMGFMLWCASRLNDDDNEK